MNVNTNAMVSMTEANQNFSRVARLVDEQGAAIIMKNNRPKYILLDFERTDAEATAPDEDVLAVSRRLMQENREAYEVLAK
ncbi:type II toxin-antitoxin system Phd/YefM family antitoxin [Selenomonas sp.]|uniref:type II toxin-antitoxin system Phd/YefM family antitoxin n=1 Tax=Selenomonas sp. TaxID=2053611 RepID=UPI0025FD2A34|nr:type II toxin-antitoxin system Phd/YefM family antitoxin [Selenomonas sp.]MCI6086394.1 type II toxin-antitoxin system Phd/YefM family antitoxin [Selenomonas sp.]MCI6283000.1 type II toxin-antitoxin system Phd/YefM family antitoxin [Selenomonas sp.]MDY3298578.1 type II toxin-antitoxin system Phd/YefM family antitoxin [Selenomonas sp.]MDY4417539.1 type II toxin-antitoxin system Phd/YefM family antitoxin [Selenomonas sp.]